MWEMETLNWLGEKTPKQEKIDENVLYKSSGDRDEVEVEVDASASVASFKIVLKEDIHVTNTVNTTNPTIPAW